MNRRGFWLVAGLFGVLFLVLFGLLAVTAQGMLGRGYRAASGRGIGVLEINGEIVDSKEALKAIRNFDAEPTIKAVLVRIDSPGGAVAPSQEIYSELKRLGETKIVVASMGSLAASGGYYIALGASHIVANPGTLTGSIGVIMQTLDASRLIALTKLDWVTYKSGDFKDMGSPFREPSAADRKLFAELIANVYHQFVKAIVDSRHLSEAEVLKIADGRVMTGEQALDKKLVDELGSFEVAVSWAAEQAGWKDDKRKPELVYPPADDDDSFFVRLLHEASKASVGELASWGARQQLETPKYLFSR